MKSFAEARRTQSGTTPEVLISLVEVKPMRRGVLIAILAFLALWGAWTLFQQHRQAAEIAIEAERDAVWNPTFQQAQTAVYAYRCDEAEPILQSMLPQTEEWWPHGPHLEGVLMMLGLCYRSDHKYELAEPLLTRALNFNDTSDPLRVARMKVNLGIIYLDQGRYTQAEQYLSEALAVAEKNTKAALADDALAMLHLGFLRELQGRNDEAQSFYTRSISVYEADLGSKPFPYLAMAYYSPAQSYERQNRIAEADTRYQQAASMFERLGEPYRLNTIHSLDGLSGMEYQLGRTEQSREISKRSEGLKNELASGDVMSLSQLIYRA